MAGTAPPSRVAPCAVSDVARLCLPAASQKPTSLRRGDAREPATEGPLREPAVPGARHGTGGQRDLGPQPRRTRPPGAAAVLLALVNTGRARGSPRLGARVFPPTQEGGGSAPRFAVNRPLPVPIPSGSHPARFSRLRLQTELGWRFESFGLRHRLGAWLRRVGPAPRAPIPAPRVPLGGGPQASAASARWQVCLLGCSSSLLSLTQRSFWLG